MRAEEVARSQESLSRGKNFRVMHLYPHVA